MSLFSPAVWRTFTNSELRDQNNLASSRSEISSSLTDESLFERVCSSNEHASFAILVTRYRQRIVGLVRRMISPAAQADIEDVAQETFVEAYRKRSSFKCGELFRPWLFRIAVNRTIDRIRAQERRGEYQMRESDSAVLAQIPANNRSNPERVVLSDEAWCALDLAISELPTKHRAALVLRYIDDLSYEEIASVVGLPVGTVKTHLFRARTELRKKFEGMEYDL